MTKPHAVSARVDKVTCIVASSPVSWADAARNAVAEASKTIHGLATARLIDTDVLVRDNTTVFRVKLEIQFQLDRNRTDTAGEQVQVRRYLIVANQTLAAEGLEQLVREKVALSAAEFHVLVPQAGVDRNRRSQWSYLSQHARPDYRSPQPCGLRGRAAAEVIQSHVRRPGIQSYRRDCDR